MKTHGIIYVVRNKVNGKRYVGLTIYSLANRRQRHEHSAKNPQAHLGPISVLFSGSLLALDVKPDPAQAEELKKKIHKGKAKDFLCELVTE